MKVTYCTQCNVFFFTHSNAHYCRSCHTPIFVLPMDLKTFSDLSLNERYKLAYKLTKSPSDVYKNNQ